MSHIVNVPSGYQVRFNLRGSKYDSRVFKNRDNAEQFLASVESNLVAFQRTRRRQSNNSSGMNGITVQWRIYKSNEPHPTLVVSYFHKKASRMTSISLNKYGIEGALRKALSIRGEPELLTEYMSLVDKALKSVRMEARK